MRTRAARFAGGFLAGFLLLPLLMLAGALSLLASSHFHLHEEMSSPPVVVSGRDVSAAGGVAAVVEFNDQTARQECRGACDDLRFEPGAVGGFGRVQVLDAAGACVLCRTADDATGSASGSWAVGGRPLALSREANR